MKKAKNQKRGRGTWISHKKRALIYARDGFSCVWCGCGLTLENHSLDHITPWCEVRDNRPCNLVSACVECNTKRGSMEPLFVPNVTKYALPCEKEAGFKAGMSRKEQREVFLKNIQEWSKIPF